MIDFRLTKKASEFILRKLFRCISRYDRFPVDEKNYGIHKSTFSGAHKKARRRIYRTVPCF